ncbi:MAG: DUF4168 domain-containing protein [Bacteroidales bacterium]
MTLSQRISVLSATGIFVFATTLSAQNVPPQQRPQQSPQPPQQQLQQPQSEPVSDAEVKQFASAFGEIQQINEKTQQKMVSTVENEGIQVDRFNEIVQSQQNPNQDAGTSEKEMESFNTAIQELQVIQNASQQEMQQAVIDEGLTVERYQELMSQVQTDANLQQRLQELMEEE